MKEVYGDMWELAYDGYDVVCITTNGAVKKDGSAVMGRGCARQAMQMFRGIDIVLGRAIKAGGNIPHMLKDQLIGNGCYVTLASFPVKPVKVIVNDDKSNIVEHKRRYVRVGSTQPGWMAMADLSIIERSAKALVNLVNLHKYEKIILPRPGCGAGGLNWKDVKPVIENILDDRFSVVTYNE